jgi:sec-independent protein translocase protein TatC
MWAFVSPGLYEHEKKYVFPYCVVAWICFIVGAVFAYLIIMPAIITFLYNSTNPELVPTWSLKGYINLMLIMFVMFGFSFDLPVVFFLLMKLGIVTPKSLASKRPYYIVGFFIISAIVTPTVDIVTQTLLAGPMIFLFEISILLGRIMKIDKKDTENSD